MNKQEQPLDAYLRQATAIDRDDPFLAARLVNEDKHSGTRALDYGRTRRKPATIEQRFRLTQRRRAR